MFCVEPQILGGVDRSKLVGCTRLEIKRPCITYREQ